LKWFLFAGAVLAGAYLAGLALRSSDVARPWIAGLVLVAGVFLPVSLGIAIVKHRLYEIDRLISRTLAFGALWLVATAGYVGIAAVSALSPVVASRSRSQSSARLLRPCWSTRRACAWSGWLIGGWVFGERLDGYGVLTGFGATLERAIDLGDLGQRLAVAVRQGLDVQWVRVTVLRRSAVSRRLGTPWSGDAKTLDKSPAFVFAATAHG